MLTPDICEGKPRSRLQQEMTPNHTPQSPSNSQNTPGKNLHFNSQQYRTPSSTQARAFLRQFNSPSTGSPHGLPSSQGARDIPQLTPRSTPRFQQLRKTPSSGGSYSSRGCRTPGMTPTDYIRNPFERNPESMSGWVFSPGVFASKGSSEDKGSPFWSIDNIAMLRPADIDENPTKYVGPLDSEAEERTQQAIEDFFNRNDFILPSPWSENGDKKRLNFLPQTPITPGVIPVSNNTKNSSPANASGKKESQYYTQESGKEEISPESLSTSSLRRKLFSNGEVGTPFSPGSETERVRPRSLPMDSEPSPVTETMCHTPNIKQRSHHTPPSNLFSSSPIRSDIDRAPQTPSLRRCSTAPDLMTSPELSPIGHSRQRARLHTEAKEKSPLSDNTPLCRPLQATPSSGRPSLPFNSPGVSPIRLEASRVEDYPVDEANSWDTRRVKNLHVKIPAPPELSADDSAIYMKTAETDMSANPKYLKEMEVDQDFSLTLDPFAASDGFRVLRGFNEFSESVVDQDPSQHPAHSIYVTHSHDTGYQTNSLQSTNHDTGLHTNLTNQFGSLLPLSSRDTGLEEDIDGSSSMDFNNADPQTLFSSTRIPVLNHEEDATTAEFSMPLPKTDPKKQSNIFTSSLDESLVRRQARKALGHIDGNQMATYGTSSKVVPGKVGVNEEHNCVTSQVVSQWKATVPTPLRRQLRHVGLIGDTTVEEQDLLPSAVASKALQRAGEDFDRYCGEPIKTLRKPKKSIIFKEILTPDVTDLQEQDFFKCS